MLSQSLQSISSAQTVYFAATHAVGNTGQRVDGDRRKACAPPVLPRAGRLRGRAQLALVGRMGRHRPRKFACRDHSGSGRSSVAFVDDEGSAEVNFPDGESESVCIEQE